MNQYPQYYKPFDRVLIANRGEIAIRIARAVYELGLKTIGIYTYEDRHSLHRFKMDEAYQVGTDDDPLKPYLDIEKIIEIAKLTNVGAIHPGYGFLSENSRFAKRCFEEGIVFIGPLPETLEMLGDKIQSKLIAKELQIPFVSENRQPLTDVEIAVTEAAYIGYSVMLKASSGGGGRGMRMCADEATLRKEYVSAKSEAAKAFGDDTLFLEKFIKDPKHIEVQILGDSWGNAVHLFERDCSIQRRFQKVVEYAPSVSVSEKTKEKIYDYALRIAKRVNYVNAGTVEFLIDKEENIYFIEVNPRIQVEHTVTEEITKVDLVGSQILISRGEPLSNPQISIESQKSVCKNGFAIQCRVTTEDPANNFKPDFGRISHYRNASGFSIRLDEGSSYPGMQISPYFDSMLVKVTASGRNLADASKKLIRALKEMRIRGVKTNIGFLLNVLQNQEFVSGDTTVAFIEKNPSLFHIKVSQDRGSKIMKFIANRTINGNPDIRKPIVKRQFSDPVFPYTEILLPVNPENAEGKLPPAVIKKNRSAAPPGTKQKLQKLGRKKFVKWIKNEKQILYTDTTLRDAHQSLFATRLRTVDMIKITRLFSYAFPQTFSLEMWGGATFDASMNFLKECPWQRLKILRKFCPNILFQMLLRGSNAVGYKAYPDNLVVEFVKESAKNGIDVFRIFDSLNWLENMKVSIDAVVKETDSLAEVAICYTGNFLNPEETRYTLNYYVDMAQRIEDAGAHILAIKDMAGLLRPYAAEILINTLKEKINLPIHLHTHNTSGNQHATYLKAIESGADVVDVAVSTMSDGTSQPSFNSIVAMMEGQERERPYDLNLLNRFSNYWGDVRNYYYPFESGDRASGAEVYEHEMPGGQYTNLRSQAEALELGASFETVKQKYILANQLLGNIVKVTPSSKVVGDFALFLTTQRLTEKDIRQKGSELNFPESLKSMLRGNLGRPPEGFPEWITKLVLKDEKPFTDRPNAYLEPLDLKKGLTEFKEKFPELTGYTDYLSWLMYPKVFEDYYQHYCEYGDVHFIPTPQFFYGMEPNQEMEVRLVKGKTLSIKLISILEGHDANGFKRLSFDFNGQNRRFSIKDNTTKKDVKSKPKVNTPNQIGSPLMGKVSSIMVKKGQEVTINQPLFVVEAMKMETIVSSHLDGKIYDIFIEEGETVDNDDLIIEIHSDIRN